ncbi:MAG: hypothetical protein E6K99_04600 [Thaumarchaeota archaeon]|nr:MAG: hypothetical protein E6K99_04600 [Nitrososphaerota archaeon]
MRPKEPPTSRCDPLVFLGGRARILHTIQQPKFVKEQEPADPLKDIKSSRGRELEGRTVILCVTGSVASIEVPSLARELMRHGAEVNAVMSEAAEKLVRPETLEWATGNPIVRRLTGKTEHVRLAGKWKGKADLVLIAPCTANTMSKVAVGIDDTPVTTMASMALGGGSFRRCSEASRERTCRESGWW